MPNTDISVTSLVMIIIRPNAVVSSLRHPDIFQINNIIMRPIIIIRA